MKFWYYELIEMLRKLLLTAVLMIYLSVPLLIVACCHVGSVMLASLGR